MLYMDTFGERLHYLRQEKNVGQVQLSKDLDVSKSIISTWEQNKCEPTLSKLVLLLNILMFLLTILQDWKNKNGEAPLRIYAAALI